MASSNTSSAFSQLVDHLLQLHFLDTQGMNDSAKADQVRDLMDEPWQRLDNSERCRVDGLSADLYSIGVDRSQPVRVDDEGARRLTQLRDAEDWDGLLELLRENEANLPPADVARLRGICWGQLDQPAVAVVFFREAALIAPHEAINEVLELNALMAAGQMDEAVKRAKMILMPGPYTSAARILEASSVLFHVADTQQGIDDELLKWSIAAAESGLELAENEPKDEILREMCRSAYLRLALSYLANNDKKKALSACQESLKLRPNDPDTLILLAWIEREENPMLAEQHFRDGFLRELNRGTSNTILHAPLL